MSTVCPDDLELVRRAVSDERARRELARRIYPKVYQVVRMVVGGRQEADDLAQTCLLEILECLSGYNGSGKLEAWAGRIAYRKLGRSLSGMKRTADTELLTGEERGETSPGSERAVQKTRARRWLAERLDALPRERRSTVVLHLVYGHTISEIADMTGVPLNTAKSRMAIGLRELRQSVVDDHETGKALLEGVDDWSV